MGSLRGTYKSCKLQAFKGLHDLNYMRRNHLDSWIYKQQFRFGKE